MIKVVKNYFLNHNIVNPVDRVVFYETQEGLENDIWNISNFVENKTGMKPRITRTETSLIVNGFNSVESVKIVWKFYPMD